MSAIPYKKPSPSGCILFCNLTQKTQQFPPRKRTEEQSLASRFIFTRFSFFFSVFCAKLRAAQSCFCLCRTARGFWNPFFTGRERWGFSKCWRKRRKKMNREMGFAQKVVDFFSRFAYSLGIKKGKFLQSIFSLSFFSQTIKNLLPPLIWF